MTVENALPNRANLDFEIFGMEGIPDDVRAAHNQRVLTAFHQAEAERRASTGNSGAGGNAGNGAKKPKFESPSDLRKRLAEHKAKKAAEEAAGVSSGDVTPMGAGMGPKSPSMPQSPAPGVSLSRLRITSAANVILSSKPARRPMGRRRNCTVPLKVVPEHNLTVSRALVTTNSNQGSLLRPRALELLSHSFPKAVLSSIPWQALSHSNPHFLAVRRVDSVPPHHYRTNK